MIVVGNQKIIVDIHEIMQQMGIKRDAFDIYVTKHADPGIAQELAGDRIQEYCNSEQDEPHTAPDKKEWQTDPAELIIATL
ncbi:hypothetical protein DUZ99_12470 [Xylanibacillus composti]|uniref:Uncharacterized protein n=1 Tax=Xylanibacillus composti TaxID=1572762 RepID=A0A8J4GYK1_9BACL|nr:hypothetical protein [Xylanibacillus composti]MDT9725785.1 hypothetical protein [Xylanibacillus composti]GIQ67499.1 hypothetical protein XYCOK13_03230 [Xylanibacillus composti]